MEALRRARARSEQRLEELTLETAQRSRVEQALAESKREAEEGRDLLQTTLASIGDAVIVTDTEERVTFLNAVAQELSGWSDTEAVGKANSEVFVIRNEKTHGLVENPIEKALREGVVVGLANHAVLINRTGREIPIEDSAAPIRNKQGRVLGIVLVFRFETVPKPTFFKQEPEVRFYEEFFASATTWFSFDKSNLDAAFDEACQSGLAALDAIHVVLAAVAGCEELVTSEKPEKSIHRTHRVRVVSIDTD